MANIDTLKSVLYDTADAIREKTGRSALIDFPDFPDEVRSIEVGGNVPNPDDPLLLVDWDGTLLYSYTAEEIPLISEFPDPPAHELLTFQGWNWSIPVIKTWLYYHHNAQLRVRAIYIASDGQDHNYWRNPRLTSSANKIYMQKRGTASAGYFMFDSYYLLSQINIPNNTTVVDSSAFTHCDSLTSIGIPKTVTEIKSGAFQYCLSLKHIDLPDNITSQNGISSIGASAFQQCNSLVEFSIPKGVDVINQLTFADCRCLTQIDLPSNVSRIRNYAFYNCLSLVDVVIHGTPTLESTDVFLGAPSNQRFYVHRSDLSWFETATNWSAIYGEGKIVAAADYIEYLQSIGIDTSDFEGE